VLASALFLILLVALIFGVYAVIWWIYKDAQANIDAGTPIVLELGAFRVETPRAWATGCLIFFYFMIPLYLVARNRQL
jgi:hypothetical protein